MVRIAVDATALHGNRTGVGVFTEQLLRRLPSQPGLEVAAFAVTWKGRGDLPGLLPPGVDAVGRPMAARPLRRCWSWADLPPIEWFVGSADVVHGPNFVVPPTRRAARVVTIHDLTPWRYPELGNADTAAYPGLVARAVRAGVWVHTVSEHVAAEVRDRLGVADDRLVVVPNGVAPTPDASDPAVEVARGQALAGGEPWILALGTVEPRKDLVGLVAAFDAVASEDPDVRLVLAGPEGWGADELATAVAASPHRRRIVRTGWVTDADRVALLRGAAVFAYPSRYEGFGLPPLEAMAAGTPVVTTRAGALPEVVGPAAELVEPGDRDALAAALARLLVDEERRAELIAAGYVRAAMFSWDRTAEGIAALYRRAAGVCSI